jgi:hypothetical protein
MAPRNKWDWLLLGGCVLLAVIVTMNALNDPGFSAPAPSPDTHTSPPSLPPLTRAAMPPLASLDSFISRPPFSESRRPPPPSGDAATATVAFELSGVVMLASDRYVLLGRPGSNQLSRAREGQIEDGWTIESILADRIVLRSAKQRAELKLGIKAAQVPTATGAPSTSPVAASRGSLSSKDTRWLPR